jgi:hypothetical protein
MTTTQEIATIKGIKARKRHADEGFSRLTSAVPNMVEILDAARHTTGKNVNKDARV